jgi:hypothetical protein
MPEATDNRDFRLIVAVGGSILLVAGILYGWSGYQSHKGSPSSDYLLGGCLVTAALVVFIDGMTWAREAQARRDARSIHPGEPWRWRPDWEQSISLPRTKSNHVPIVVASVYAIELLPFVPWRVRHGADWFDMAMIGFGAVLFIWAGLRIAANRKQSGSICRLQTRPAIPGGAAKGIVETTVRDVEAVHLRLECIEVRSRNSASSHGPTEYREEVWHCDQTVPATALGRGPRGVNVPFAFEIPSDAIETVVPRGHLPVEWNLIVKAPAPGLDYAARFEIPVFRLDGHPVETPDAAVQKAWELLKGLQKNEPGGSPDQT